MCSSVQKFPLNNFTMLHMGYFSESTVDFTSKLVYSFKISHILIFVNSSIPSVSFASQSGVVESVVVFLCSNNKVLQLQNNCLQVFNKVKTVSLNENKIETLHCDTFIGSDKIELLALSNNDLTTLDKCHLQNLKFLQLVNFTENAFQFISKDNYANIVGKLLVNSSTVSFCCLKNNVVCSNNIKKSNQCVPLLVSNHCGTVSLLFGFSGLVFNFLRYWKKEEQKAFNKIIKCLSCSNMLYCSFLLFVASLHQYFGDSFVFIELLRRKSFFCTLNSFLFTFSIHLCVCSAMLLSFSHFYVVYHPIDTKYKDPVFVQSIISSVFVGVFIISVTSTILLSRLESCPKQCVPLNCQSTVTNLTTAFLAVLAIVTSFLVVFLNIRVVTKVLEKKENLLKSKTKQSTHKYFIIKVTLNIVCACITWLPSGTIFILSLTGQIHDEIIIWCFVTILPIYAITIPMHQRLALGWIPSFLTTQCKKKKDSK